MSNDLPNGIIVKQKHANAPDFVMCDISFKVEEFIQYLRENDNAGWVNVQLLISKGGKPYAKLNDWKPESQGSTAPNAYQAKPQQQTSNQERQQTQSQPLTENPPSFDDINDPDEDCPF